MNNNDILKRLRYILNYNDSVMVDVFGQAEFKVDLTQVQDWLKKEDDPDFKKLHDKFLAIFLNGLINKKRGKKEGPQVKPEKRLNNNLILRKLKIALNLKDEDMIGIFKLIDIPVSKHEISAFFRKPGQKQYRDCKDQYLRNFLFGLQVKYRPKQ